MVVQSVFTTMMNASHFTPNVTRPSLIVAGGYIVPTLSKFAFSRQEWDVVMQHLIEIFHPSDFIVLLLLAFATVPFFNLLCIRIGSKYVIPYESTYLYQIAVHISQMSQLAIVVYAVDCICVILGTLGFTFVHLNNMARVFAKVLFIAWAAQRLSVFKYYCLCRATTGQADKIGNAYLIDRLADGLLFVGTSLFLLDVLDVEMGVGITSMFAFGSASTLLFGLASRDFAAMVVSGVTLTTSDRIRQGDFVSFGDGTCGRVEKIGWMQTVILNNDEKFEVVPNSHLGNQRVKNLSRVKKCCIKQRLRFSYNDAEKLPQVLQDIMDEIKASCPLVIIDGTRPFRAVWTDYKEDYLSILVEAHFDIPCLGKRYWNNRQTVMLAISRAVSKNNVQFVTSPAYPFNKSIMNTKSEF